MNFQGVRIHFKHVGWGENPSHEFSFLIHDEVPVSFSDNLSESGFECKIKCNDDDNDDLFLILPAARPHVQQRFTSIPKRGFIFCKLQLLLV